MRAPPPPQPHAHSSLSLAAAACAPCAVLSARPGGLSTQSCLPLTCHWAGCLCGCSWAPPCRRQPYVRQRLHHSSRNPAPASPTGRCSHSWSSTCTPGGGGGGHACVCAFVGAGRGSSRRSVVWSEAAHASTQAPTSDGGRSCARRAVRWAALTSRWAARAAMTPASAPYLPGVGRWGWGGEKGVGKGVVNPASPIGGGLRTGSPCAPLPHLSITRSSAKSCA
jgi:hypothetical protein